MTASTDRSRTMPRLPRPTLVATVLTILAHVCLIAAVVAVILIWTVDPYRTAGWRPLLLLSIQVVLVGTIAAAVLGALALMVRYQYHTALNIRLAERRLLIRQAEAGQEAAGGTDLTDQVVILLRDINENTLLADEDKARKRARLADTRRSRIKREIGQFIAATKWPAARSSLDELRAEYPEDPDLRTLSRQLDEAIAEHREIDIMASSEQIRSYMSLGLWDRAQGVAAQLAQKYPDIAAAQKMQDVVRLEEESHHKDDRLRLYREIEHLVTRKHYGDAKRVAEQLISRHPDSPEAATLRGQMDELERNADIEIRRSMEAQIIEHTKQSRHKEAYEIARLVMEQYPESPQAIALKDQIEKLRERAGM